jgi:hypothetical protein
MKPQVPAPTSDGHVDVLATLIALQEQVEQLTAAVAAQQRTLGALTRTRNQRVPHGRGQ